MLAIGMAAEHSGTTRRRVMTHPMAWCIERCMATCLIARWSTAAGKKDPPSPMSLTGTKRPRDGHTLENDGHESFTWRARCRRGGGRAGLVAAVPGKGSVLAAEAMGTQVKGGALAAEALGTHEAEVVSKPPKQERHQAKCGALRGA